MSELGQKATSAGDQCGSVSPSKADMVGHKRYVRFVRILLKKSKIAKPTKSRESRMLRSQPQQGSAEPIRASVIVFALIDVVPHIAAREAHERP